jgi:hypothetical protein
MQGRESQNLCEEETGTGLLGIVISQIGEEVPRIQSVLSGISYPSKYAVNTLADSFGLFAVRLYSLGFSKGFRDAGV